MLFMNKMSRVEHMNKMSRVENMKEIQRGLELFIKNADYGDAFAKYGIAGVLIRVEDKIQLYIDHEKWYSIGE